jgi:hypothetical protein
MLITLIVAGCAAGGGGSSLSPELIAVSPVNLTPAQIAIIQAGVRAKLKDPDSARFGIIRAGANASGQIMVCGMINAKNSYGGYSGMSPFMGDLSSTAFKLDGMAGGDSEGSAMMLALCNRQGIAL